MRHHTTVLFAALLLLAGAGCGSREPAVGSLAAAPESISLPHSAWSRIELTWKMRRELAEREGELRVSMHLLDRAGDVLRTFDHPFPGGWKVGEERRYEVEVYQSALGPPLEPGEYDLVAGLYDLAGHRWSLDGAGEATSAGQVWVATLAAVEPPEGFPELYFSAAWLPIEAGTDRQILGRRWLGGDGAIKVAGIREPGAVWLGLGVPDGSGERQELVLEEGAAVPSAVIATDCSGFEAEVAGSASHTLEIPVAPAGAEPGECEIRIRANFELVSLENGEKRTVALENVAWSGGGSGR